MSETTPSPDVPGATPETAKPADAAQKKQTVRISLPPKPAGGPSIRLPAAGAAPAPVAAATAAPAAPAAPAAARPAPPAPPTSAPAMGMSGGAAKPAAPAAAAAAAPAAKAVAAPARASVSGLDIGLALATVLCSLATAAILFLNQPTP